MMPSGTLTCNPRASEIRPEALEELLRSAIARKASASGGVGAFAAGGWEEARILPSSPAIWISANSLVAAERALQHFGNGGAQQNGLGPDLLRVRDRIHAMDLGRRFERIDKRSLRLLHRRLARSRGLRGPRVTQRSRIQSRDGDDKRNASVTARRTSRVLSDMEAQTLETSMAPYALTVFAPYSFIY